MRSSGSDHDRCDDDGQNLPIRDGVFVAYVDRLVAPGIIPDLVLVDQYHKVINIHDLTLQPQLAHIAKGHRYEKYFQAKFPDYQVQYTEEYWRGLEDAIEALSSKGVKYFPGTTKP